MSKILIINGNPKKQSFSLELSESYASGAKQAGNFVEIINLSELNFDFNLNNGYDKEIVLEPELLEIQNKIKNSRHLVFVYPIWWGTYPAIFKGFIDKIFIPGFAFRYKQNSPLPEKLLTGKTARIITTMDTPKFYYNFFYKSPGHNSLKKCVLNFCGIKPVRITNFTPIKKSTLETRKKWLKIVEELGKKGG